MTSDQIKAVIASYWRYIRQCPVIALEINCNLHPWSGETADILTVDKNRFLIETEVKVTLSDLRRDAKKNKHKNFLVGHSMCVARYFYFAVPRDIANDVRLVCDDLFPYAGILATNGLDEYEVEIYRHPKPLASKRLTYSQALRLIFSQSGTVCRLAKKVEELLRVQKNLEKQLKEYRDMEMLERRCDGAGES